MHAVNQILIIGHQETQKNILIAKKLIEIMSKKYLNNMKNLNLDKIHANDELYINNWSI